MLRRTLISFAVAVLLGGGIAAAQTQTDELEPMQDATLYETAEGDLANGSGSHLFVGRTAPGGGSAERRAVLAFPIADEIPAGATITDVELDLMVSRTISGDQTVELLRVLEGWSEGPSDAAGEEGAGAPAEAGDVTWLHREFPDTLWLVPGGTVAASPSASLQIGGVGRYTFSSTPELVGDVQDWLDEPAMNFGWAMVMPEPPVGSAKRFDSRENLAQSNRPLLRVTYQLDTPPPAFDFTYFINGTGLLSGAEGSFFVTDLDLNNAGDEMMTYKFQWLPRGQDNSTPLESAELTLAAGHGVRFENVLEEVFGLEPDVAGTVALLADSADALTVSRVFNLPPAKVAGTFGQAFPGIPADEMTPTGVTNRIIFMSQNDDLRANLGCQNGVDEDIEIRIELFDSVGTLLQTRSMALGPWSNDQINRIFRNFAPVNGYVDVWTETEDASFFCYGSLLDNETSDPTTILPQ